MGKCPQPYIVVYEKHLPQVPKYLATNSKRSWHPLSSISHRLSKVLPLLAQTGRTIGSHV